ncbi:ABC transporter ATP-binding protein [Neorhizobium galegae]|uniref:Branched-chain amino acid ABC transporter, ATP-binding protein n=1 Tax=Neorhizobium galegae bv. orientalis str. HAMBI 540 TaxID=1028800 RepID=A0A068SUZ0_NEOGA|nr:ABC transporter ATP-binding protein [Neorhizobium galegae]MCQ1571403.1 ABC transporter ATP-binding protein [Neorhizobium galegae]CDN48860.1 Branched-chain amino acid ABC transporter, ATP-binding protein [Neorhizobium galegae bv. orientalis str. HAMBI 540]CDZ55204.1 ABC-type branched-chain amino acid transport system, ATPase component [Neorhizobium galegae bv. orientalis]
MSALELNNLSKSFGGLHVINDVSFKVMEGERRLILGPNGAGKTTLFNLIAGDLAPSFGTISLAGEDVSALPTNRRAARGIGRTFQILTLFSGETVIRNVVLASLGRTSRRWKPFGSLDADEEFRASAMEILRTVMLDHIADKCVSETSYGERRRLEIAMALAQQPRLLLLDEPLAGLSKEERKGVEGLLNALPRSLTVIMIEHDMDVALGFADRIALLQNGKLLVDGSRDEVIADPRTKEAYLAE